ncbi:MAG TPA: DUF3455 domain-containing protein [Edaphobacter sp.]|nr:DUF3455 domain-containing protein [Edaphobacter sp.]
MLLALILFASLLSPQGKDSTEPPAGARAVYVVEGRGVQIYRCAQQGPEFGWVFDAPEAKLFDASTQEQMGTHGAGPVWTWKDGSSVTGKVLEKAASPDPTSIPWLLLAATPTGTNGALSKVAFVRRSETHGGNAPATGCDAEHAGGVLRVPYTATYSFYGAQ